MFSLALLFVLVFLRSFQHCDYPLGKRELVYVLLMHLYVYFARVNFCPFSLLFGIRG